MTFETDSKCRRTCWEADGPGSYSKSNFSGICEFCRNELNQMMNDLKESGFLYSSVIIESEVAEARAALAVSESPAE